MTGTQERDEAICRAYLSPENKSAERLAIEYGLGVSSVWKILKKGEVKKPPGPRVRKLPEEKQMGLSHIKIGLRLSYYRSFTLAADRPKLAEKLGWSLQKVAHVEQGQFNLSLVDLQDLATLFKMELWEFFQNDKSVPGILENDASSPEGTS